MNRFPSYLFALSMGALTACSTPAPDKVEQIKSLPVPLVVPGAKPNNVPMSHLASLFQENKQHIDGLTDSLKIQYLQHVTTRDIFDRDSDVQRVYASLSKLEQLGMINQQYFKEHNEVGLEKINTALQPLIVG